MREPWAYESLKEGNVYVRKKDAYPWMSYKMAMIMSIDYSSGGYRKRKWGPIFGLGCDKPIGSKMRLGCEWNATVYSGLSKNFENIAAIPALKLVHKTDQIWSHQLIFRLSYCF